MPSFRALWYLNVTAALTASPNTTKQKKSIGDHFSAVFLTQFLRQINSNLILARRLAHMIAMKLRLYKMEYDEQNNSVSKGVEAFTAIAQYWSLRPVIHLLTTILQNIVIDAPAAVIWNKFKIVHHQVLNQQSFMFGPFHMQYIILNYFYTEASTIGSKHYHQEFAALLILFIETSRHKLFEHDR
ncbi:hypothetical protein KIN20_027795 [Parelaphostrongylus tenuis]|uniref:Uncharacterized protein n=1 Tax=Parelaphostrongylus tenuis TaxID=148309 RepID=A0AAD5QZT5_PARTN|nr:hypothetical protein KIN20_027795 [Parelaphostrongylus tenuis]